MKKNFLFVFFVAVALFAQSNKDDSWVESGQMLRFPSNKYFTAVGVGNSEKNASENAVVEIRKQISATIKSEQISQEFSLQADGVQKDSSVFNVRSKISVFGNVAGVEIIATSTRKNNFYAFAALEKGKFISQQKMKIAELQKELTQTYNSANKAISEKKTALAISLLNTANEKIAEIRYERLLLSSATVLTENEKLPVSKADVDTKIAELWYSIKISAVGGNKQVVFVGEIPAEPFAVKVLADDAPVENLPVALFDEKNRRIAAAQSDNNGLAYLFLSEKSPSSKGTYKYNAKIDLPGVPQNLSTIGLSYSVKARNVSISAKINVSVNKSIPKNGVQTIEQAAREMLSQNGILDDKCGCIKVTVSVSDEQKEAIDGVSAARSFYRSDATAQIAIEDKNGKQIYSGSVKQLGVGKDRILAVADGLKKVQLGEILGEIQEAVKNYELQEAQKQANKLLNEKKKIVVLPFIYRGFDGYFAYSNYESLSSMVNNALVNTNAFAVLERQQLAEAQFDRRYSDWQNEQAKTLGANWAVVGDVTQNNETIEVDIRVVDVFTSQIIASVNASGESVYDFRDIAKELVDKLNVAPVPVVEELGGGCCD